MPSLPPLTPTANGVQIAASVNALVKEYNREDRKAPIVGTDTGSGAAYVIAPVPGIVLYEVGQEFTFQAANTNTTTTPTLAVNGLTAGTITYLDGSALAVGDIAAGGWADVIVASVTAGTPTFALISTPSVAGRRFLQMVSFETGAVATGTTLIPFDDTIPQNTEGDQYMSLAITPKSATSKLVIEVIWTGGVDNTTNLILALFKDSDADAIAVTWAGHPSAAGVGGVVTASLRHVISSGATSAMTFKVRAGVQAGLSASTATMNGFAGARAFGGTMASSIVIREYAA